MTEILSKYNWTSVGLFVGIIIVAHIFTSSPYDWKNNTISELAAQDCNYKWIMKIGLLIFGITAESMNLKIIHFATFLFVIGFSALFGIMDSNVGIIQRVMYLGSFVWLIFFYNELNKASG